ncbi:hypothetical protein RIF29_15597 [Crotalaria pallida]|uniref:TF-B3 domain-containing protein n=1 Tax=Crotalaria pallida TaxID=3830 RepID=A0AAN9FF34_CROPI
MAPAKTTEVPKSATDPPDGRSMHEASHFKTPPTRNLPPIFVNACINNQLNTITLRGIDANGNGNGLETTCGLYVNDPNYRITNGWRDFCHGMGIEAGFGLVLGVVDEARNIVTVQIEDHGNNDDDNEDNNDE